MSRLCWSLVLSLLIAPSAEAVAIDWVPVGNPGNPADTQAMLQDGTTGYGAVAYAYHISRYEVTNGQYTEFLNAVADADPNALYNTDMAFDYGGITRAGTPGSYTYSAIAGRENKPVNSVSFHDALRFANWLQNGQPTGAQGPGTTETGSYTITAQGIADNTITRNAGASIVLTSENEWYKAAYYHAPTNSYFDYPAGSNTQPTCSTPTAATNRANCGFAVDNLTNQGSYPGSPSPYGTFDQGGNVWEWNESIIEEGFRGIRGGSWNDGPAIALSASNRSGIGPPAQASIIGFRVAMVVPEPGTGLLVIAGLLGVAGWRRART